MQKYPFYKSFLAKIIIFLEVEGSARPKTSFLIKRQAPSVIASDRREYGNPDFFSSGSSIAPSVKKPTKFTALSRRNFLAPSIETLKAFERGNRGSVQKKEKSPHHEGKKHFQRIIIKGYVKKLPSYIKKANSHKRTKILVLYFVQKHRASFLRSEDCWYCRVQR